MSVFNYQISIQILAEKWEFHVYSVKLILVTFYGLLIYCQQKEKCATWLQLLFSIYEYNFECNRIQIWYPNDNVGFLPAK